MKAEWLALGFRLLPYILAAAQAIEERLPGATGAEKKAAVMKAVREIVETAEGIAGRDLFDDERVLEQVSQAIDIIVALQNTVSVVAAKK